MEMMEAWAVDTGEESGAMKAIKIIREEVIREIIIERYVCYFAS